MVKRFLSVACLAIFSFAAMASEAAQYNPVADSRAIVESGNARFTVLTPRLIRMEWAENGKFEDRATLAIVNRNLEVPYYKVRKNGGKVTISTENMTLTYSGNGKFSQDNLKVDFTMSDPLSRKGIRTVTWKPGMDESGNLLGTTRTLDKCDGTKTVEPYDPGVLSRDGWAIIDETARPVLVRDGSDWGEWVEERDSTDRADLYIFAYGHEYKDALADFTKVAGKIPLPPKYAFGYWWSRYWQYSDFEFVDLAKTIRSLNIPIDVMVIDMDWHETWTLRRKGAPKDEFGQRIGWTGYTWQGQLFPAPENFLADIHNLDMKTSLNLHPASGIQPYEECYDRFIRDYTSRTSEYDGPEGFVDKDGKKAPVPFRISSQQWTDAYFNSVIHPLEDMGVDFWWLDWQQWKYSKYMPSLNNTFWLNWTFFNDKVRRLESQGTAAERPMIYHRWGGIGSHRYQIGFSGDTYDTWEVLGYLPYFTSTSSNVGYGYWGHDIGGHMQKKPHPTDPEMYTRWLQYGVFTPIFKTHSTKTPDIERRLWAFPEYFSTMREAIRLRYSLSPYIYNAARTAYDTGISMCRPMYYDYPESDEAYTWNQQYMFGDDILVTVLDRPADEVTGLTGREIWFPAGNSWYDMATGEMIEGGQCITRHYTINENPYFVKAGAIIPMASPDIQSLQEESNEIYFFVAPGDGQSTARLYEDDGRTQAYGNDYAVTDIFKSSADGNFTMKISARKGSYNGMPAGRKVRIVLDGILPPSCVKVNGKEIPWSRFAKDGEWKYDGKELAATILLPEMPADKDIAIECTMDSPSDIYGKKGLLKRMAAITPEAKMVFGGKVDSYIMLPIPFLKVAQCSSFITEDPANTGKYLSEIDQEAVNAAFAEYGTLPEDFKLKIKAQGSL
ncbi:MAG: DUF5110 domain-containing protein [Bacteroidales bacterium]|nr:DUF5110 domain-containing protein [Bacteroidales bacterium]